MNGANLNSSLFRLLSCFLLLCLTIPQPLKAESRNAELLKMLKEVQSKAQADISLLKSFRKVPRHKFVSEELNSSAYENRELSDQEGSVTVNPVLFARMINASKAEIDSNVLIVGAGSGYQAAVLANLFDSVDVLESSLRVAKTAKKRIQELSLSNINFFIGSPKEGVGDQDSYDAIFAFDEDKIMEEGMVFPKLISPMGVSGKLVLPKGSDGMTIKVGARNEDGKLEWSKATFQVPSKKQVEKKDKSTGWKIRGLAR